MLVALIASPVALIALCPFSLVALYWLRDHTPPTSAATQLRADIGVSLPASASQLHAKPQPSGIDPATWYDLQIAPVDLPGWLASIATAAKARGWDTGSGETMSNSGAPAWWAPAAYPDLQSVSYMDLRPGGNGFAIYYSLSKGRVFIFWWNT